jgi:HAD superfamily hydrolase (TIGR01509 family)
MTETPLRAVLWDMDGTLIDSGEYHWRTWRETLAELGVTLTREDFNGWFGSRNDRILRRYFPEIGPGDMLRIGTLKEERYRALVRRDGVTLLPGVGGWLARLARAGWRQAVASSAPPANIDVLVEVLGLTGVFQAIVSAEEVAQGKPAPDVFLRAAEKVGVPPARCVVVEDAAIGVEAGRRGGMRTIGIEGGHGHGPLAADVVTRSMADLPLDTFDRLLSP